MIVRHPKAVLDAVEAAEFIGLDSPGAAARFVDAVEDGLRFVHEHPEIGRWWGSRRERFARVRFWPVPGFPNHLVFYRQVDSGIEWMRLMHGARDLDDLLSGDVG